MHLSDEEAEEDDEKKVDEKTQYSLLEKARKATTRVNFYKAIKEHIEKGYEVDGTGLEKVRPGLDLATCNEKLAKAEKDAANYQSESCSIAIMLANAETKARKEKASQQRPKSPERRRRSTSPESQRKRSKSSDKHRRQRSHDRDRKSQRKDDEIEKAKKKLELKAKKGIKIVYEKRPDDWPCKHCNDFPNYAFRHNCFKCHAPKPASFYRGGASANPRPRSRSPRSSRRSRSRERQRKRSKSGDKHRRSRSKPRSKSRESRPSKSRDSASANPSRPRSKSLGRSRGRSPGRSRGSRGSRRSRQGLLKIWTEH